jgi:hypothetical protein
MGACVEPFEPSTLFCPLVTSEGNNFRTGWRINVGIGIFLGLNEQAETRIGEGDETGWGIKDGRLPPRLVGGVTQELDERLRDSWAADGLEGRHEVEESNGLAAIGRGIDDGEAEGGMMEAEERGRDGGGVIITGKATAGGDGWRSLTNGRPKLKGITLW